ncbi:MAG: type III secretion system export apparatus subunit SctV, partial [Pseudomonadales bacterium]|nr:type III secretion system export apparatus subunit SctV [Pseudomonadales bacterium]
MATMLNRLLDFKRADSAQAGGASSYGDIALAFGVVAIIALMILPLPIFIVDMLVAVNILLAVGLVLIAIYIPTPVAFSSFPSVILLSTLFRLALSIAITRLILLNGDAGHIIEAFGRMVVGGNMVVGIVVFVIITVVQFVVIAKGSERVAEVSARFSLDAMPGKQMSIDSDLRSGILDKDEARRRRHLLELESQLHGSLDGAMKFVKGDAIAGIIIVLVNIIGGLAIGVLQRGMPLGDAVQTYSILTVGDGLVAQIPALMTSIAAGLIITRSTGEAHERHLGDAIGRQLSAYPRVVVIGGILSLLLTLVPGFPWPVFLVMGILLLLSFAWRTGFPPLLKIMGKSPEVVSADSALVLAESATLQPPDKVVLSLSPDMLSLAETSTWIRAFSVISQKVREEYGIPIPKATPRKNDRLTGYQYSLEAYGVTIATGAIEPGRVFVKSDVATPTPSGSHSQAAGVTPAMQGYWGDSGEVEASGEGNTSVLSRPEVFLQAHLELALTHHLDRFLGIQETSNLVNLWSQDYPDLVKETLRVVPPQRLNDILKRLLRECIPVRNLRDIFEAVTEFGPKEKDIALLSEHIRIAIRRQISDRYSGTERKLKAVLTHPEIEEAVRQSIREPAQVAGQHIPLDPELMKQISEQLNRTRNEHKTGWEQVVLLCSADVRRFIRKLLEEEFFALPVLSYQELTGDVQVE